MFFRGYLTVNLSDANPYQDSVEFQWHFASVEPKPPISLEAVY